MDSNLNQSSDQHSQDQNPKSGLETNVSEKNLKNRQAIYFKVQINVRIQIKVQAGTFAKNNNCKSANKDTGRKFGYEN